MEKTYKQKLFDEYLKIIPTIEYLETERKKTLFSVILLKCLMGIITFAGVFLYMNIKNYGFIVGCLAIIGAMILLFKVDKYSNNIAKKYTNRLKNQCFDKILQILGFANSNIINFLQLLDVNGYIFDCFKNKKQCEDCYGGVYKNVNFVVGEIKQSSIKAINDYDNFWNGVVCSIKTPKKAKSPIIVVSRNTKNKIKRFFYNMGGLSIIFLFLSLLLYPLLILLLIFFVFLLIKFFNVVFTCCLILIIAAIMLGFKIREFLKSKKVSLEDVEFKKRYDVQSTDQIEARYILTTAFIERLENLKTVFKSNDIRVFLEDDNMTIAIGTRRDLFEIGDIYHSLYDFKQLEQFYNEITAIIGIIDHFKLDEKTGL